jgi:predicted RNA-binding Zn ribbon-like protein
MALLAKELDARPKESASKDLAEDIIKSDEENREHQNEMLKNNKEQSKEKSDHISMLKDQLNDANEKIASLQETVDKLIEAQKENRENNTESLKDILKSKKT